MEIILDQKRLTIEDKQAPASLFLIERFDVPENLKKLIIKIEAGEAPIKCLLVYDADYNLRAEIQRIVTDKKVMIGLEDKDSSLGTKPGYLPRGEWIFVVQAEEPIADPEWYCDYQIVGLAQLDSVSQEL